MIVRAISQQCFVFMVISSTMITLVAIIGDGSLFHHQLLKLATRLVPQCTTKSAMFTINKCIYNQPYENFVGKDLNVVAVLVCARGTKHD